MYSKFKQPKVIAEIGCNHMGNIDIAIEMISVAKTFCKVDVVKFQKRDIDFWAKVKPEIYNSPHPNPMHSYGDTYLEHRKALEFDIEQHKILKDYCDSIGIEYSCSVWDVKSAMEIASLNPNIIKVPSAANNNYELLEWLCDNFMGEIHVSTGMTGKSEIEDIVNFFIKKRRNDSLVIYHCISGYPVAFKDTYLLEIDRLVQKYGTVVKDIGYSGHHLGIAIDIAAYTLGANVIERHFTLDRTWKGTDHAASLEPDGLRKLKRDLMATYEALKYKDVDLLEFEVIQKEKLKFKDNK
ncbi:MAG: N-acetylneuraminate synthase family protein [Candidatus Micrarchaeia archaeon]